MNNRVPCTHAPTIQLTVTDKTKSTGLLFISNAIDPNDCHCRFITCCSLYNIYIYLYCVCTETKTTNSIGACVLSLTYSNLCMNILHSLVSAYNKQTHCDWAVVVIVAFTAQENGNQSTRREKNKWQKKTNRMRRHWHRRRQITIFVFHKSVNRIVDIVNAIMIKWFIFYLQINWTFFIFEFDVSGADPVN